MEKERNFSKNIDDEWDREESKFNEFRTKIRFSIIIYDRLYFFYILLKLIRENFIPSIILKI